MCLQLSTKSMTREEIARELVSITLWSTAHEFNLGRATHFVRMFYQELNGSVHTFKVDQMCVSSKVLYVAQNNFCYCSIIKGGYSGFRVSVQLHLCTHVYTVIVLCGISCALMCTPSTSFRIHARSCWWWNAIVTTRQFSEQLGQSQLYKPHTTHSSLASVQVPTLAHLHMMPLSTYTLGPTLGQAWGTAGVNEGTSL